MCMCVSVCKSENNMQKSILFFYHVGPGICTQISRQAAKHLDQWFYFSRPKSLLFNHQKKIFLFIYNILF